MTPQVSPISAGILLVASLIGLMIYRAFLHPLAKYPGPLLSRLTEWNEFFAVKTGDHHIWLYELHEKYGPVVRVAPNRLSYNTIEALRSIYGDRKANIRKSGFTEMLATLSGGRNLQTINDRSLYSVRRRLISHAFSEEALRSSEKYILDCIRNWCQILRSKADDPNSWTPDINMTDWTSLLTEDVLGDLCFGESFGACDRGASTTAGFIVDAGKQAQQLCWMPLPQAFYSLIKVIADYGMKRKWKAMQPQLNYENTMRSMIGRRMKDDNQNRKDIFHYILQAKDFETGTTISQKQIETESGVLFGAGMDTSATCLAACLFYLTYYPETLAKATAEIRSTFKETEDIVQGPHLSSLTYLRACIDEALRLAPPAPGPMLRITTEGGITVDGDFVPSGVEVSVCAYAIHHNEGYFPDAWTFNPDRWLPNTLAASKDAFCAFQLGPRVCIGRQLAYLDMTLALARLLFIFDIRQSSDVQIKLNSIGKFEYQLKDWFITEHEGPIVQLKARV